MAEQRPSARPALRLGLAVVIVACCAAGFAIAFRSLLSQALQVLAGADDVVTAARALPWWITLPAPCVGALLAGTVSWYAARRGEAQSVGDVMEAIVLGRVRLSMRTTLFKSLASWLAIASGGSIGREGPLIQFGGSIGKVVGNALDLPSRSLRALIAAGTAAGFAAAYNTPFAAVLFVLEVVAGVMVLETMVPVVLATVIATALTRAVVGAGPIYGLRAFSLRSPAELALYAGLAVLAAAAAQAFMRLLAWSEGFFQRTNLALPWRPALGGLITGLLVTAVPEVAGNGYEPLQELLGGGAPLRFVVVLLVVKALATAATVSSGSPGGVFTPALLVGGAAGAVYAAALAGLGIPHGPAGGYVLVGMAAATAATTHAPLMAAVMAFELSGDYAVVLPLLLATALAAWLSRRWRVESVYTAELAKRGLRWELTMDGRRVISERADADTRGGA